MPVLFLYLKAFFCTNDCCYIFSIFASSEGIVCNTEHIVLLTGDTEEMGE